MRSSFSMKSAAPRIAILDVIRGFAVLGILKINIYGSALPQAAALNPSLGGGVTGLNLVVLGFDALIADGRMRALFCMLFGAAFFILVSRAKTDGGESGGGADSWLRRNLWLMGFGVVHAYVLLWSYDILFFYGLAGLFLFPLRKLTPRMVFWIAFVWIGVSAAGNLLQWKDMREIERKGKAAVALEKKGAKLVKADRDAIEEYREQQESYHPPKETIAEETATRRGGYLSNFAWNAKIVHQSHHIVPYGLEFVEILVTMLIGMALFQIGVLSGERSQTFYTKLAFVSYGVALPAQAFIFWRVKREGFDPLGTWTFLVYGVLYQPLRYLTALGHLSSLVLLVQGRYLPWLTSRLAAAGRMALTNYLLQSVYCAFVFYGFGLGLFARLDRWGLFGVCAVIWLFELLVSPLWLTRFRSGPVEWLWRSLTWGEREPFRLSGSTSPSAQLAP